MAIAGSARIRRLNPSELGGSEIHGRRLDEAAMRRKVREEPSLTWVPEGVTGDPLALPDRLADHIAGAFVPQGGDAVALHLLVTLPDSVPTTTKEEAEAAMMLAVEFAQSSFGGNAVFSARIDRDEAQTNIVDVFLAPRYEKVTARSSKPAISMSKHLKALATLHGRKTNLRGQGQGLQDELAAWFDYKGFEVERGKPKTTHDPDWVFSEALAAATDREQAEKARQDAIQAEERAAERVRAAEALERDVRGRETLLLNSQARAAAVKLGQDRARDQIQTGKADLAREREAFETEANVVRAVARELDRILQPILDMAKRWNEAKGIVGQSVQIGMGAKGKIAVEAAESPEVGVLAALMAKLKGVTR